MHVGAHLTVCALADLLDFRVAPLNAGAPAEFLVLIAQDRHLDLPIDGHHECGRLEHLPHRRALASGASCRCCRRCRQLHCTLNACRLLAILSAAGCYAVHSIRSFCRLTAQQLLRGLSLLLSQQHPDA